MAKKRHLTQYDSAGNKQEIYLNDDEVMVAGGQTLQEKLSDMEEDIDEAASQGGIQQETDPTVPAWAKRPNPPTPQEIGAVPAQGYVPLTQSEKTKLDNLPTADQLATQLGNKANSSEVVKSISVNGQAQQTPQNGNVNIDAYTKAQTEAKIAEAVEDIEAGETVVASVDDIDIVDNVAGENGDTILAAPSARMVKEIYLNLKALFNPESGLANLAFVGTRPTWQTVAKRHYTLTFGTLDGLDSTTPVKDADGNAVTSGTQVNEGYLKLVLVPQSAGHVFTSITINGEQVMSIPTGDADGSRYIEITVAGPITLAASAVSGRAVIFTGSTGCTIDDNSVQAGQSLDTTIRANKYYNLPQSIIVRLSGTSANVAHTYTPAQDGKTARLQVASADITGNLEVICIAARQTPITVSLSGSHVTYKHGNDVLGSSENIYPDDIPYTVNIKPETDYALAANGITLPSGLSAVSDNDGGFNVTIDSFPSGNITIQATATSNFWNVTVPSNVQNLTVTDANDAAFESNTVRVTKGSAFTCFIKAETLWKANVAVTVGGSAAADGYYTYNQVTGELVIAQVTADVVITATAVSNNPAYKNILYNYLDSVSGGWKMHLYPKSGIVSKAIPIGDGMTRITFTTGDSASASNSEMHFLDESLVPFMVYTQNAAVRTVAIPQGAKYVCVATTESRYPDAKIWAHTISSPTATDLESMTPIFEGASADIDTAIGADDFLAKFGPIPDVNGNIPASVSTNDNKAGMFIYVGNGASAGYPTTNLVSEKIALPEPVNDTISLNFYGGEVPSGQSAPRLLVYNDSGETASYVAGNSNTADNSNTQSLNKKYKYCRLWFNKAKYYDNQNYHMWIKDPNDNNRVLWSNDNIVDLSQNQSEE